MSFVSSQVKAASFCIHTAAAYFIEQSLFRFFDHECMFYLHISYSAQVQKPGDWNSLFFGHPITSALRPLDDYPDYLSAWQTKYC